MNENLKKNATLKLELTNNLNLIDNREPINENFLHESRSEGIRGKNHDDFNINRTNFVLNDPFNKDPIYSINDNLINRSGYVSVGEREREDLDAGFSLNNTRENKGMKMKGNTLEEGFKVLKFSKDLRKEKEESLHMKKTQKI